MFERYTESARRALFFARSAVTQLGGPVIGTDHVILGLIHEGHGIVPWILDRSDVAREGLREEIEARVSVDDRVAFDATVPFSDETRRALQFAADEADDLGHHHIGTEHMLLGLLREEQGGSTSILTSRGLRLDDVRHWLVQRPADWPDGDVT